MRIFRREKPKEPESAATGIGGIFDALLHRQESRKRTTLLDPFSGQVHDLSEAYNPLDVRFR